MYRLKLRLQLAGSTVCVLSLGLMAFRGIRLEFEGLFAVGMVVLVAGVFWKKSVSPSSSSS